MKEIIKQNKVVAVIRANTHNEAQKIVKATLKGGIKCIELTYSIPKVPELITKLKEKYKDGIFGVGSVINEEMAINVINAGAKYVVSPGYSQEVNEVCKKMNILYIPGCMTITEMMFVLKNGNSLVKLFQGNIFGVNFIKSIKVPLPQIEIIPTGGVDVDNIKEWLKAGVVCVGVGSSLTGSNDMKIIEDTARKFIKKVDEYEKGV